MTRIKRFLNLIPLLILWAMACGLFWGFVFSRITDAPADQKIVIYIDAETPGAAKLADILFDSRSQHIRLVEVRPFSFAMMNSSSLENADIYIVPESSVSTYREWFEPADDGWIPAAPFYSVDDDFWGALVFPSFRSSSTLHEYINFTNNKDENYFLLFGRRSLHFAAHPDAVDDEAVRFAELLIRQL